MIQKADFEACENACKQGVDCRGAALQNLLRTMAISNGQLERLPWDQVLWEDKPLPYFGSTAEVPESLLSCGRNARSLMNNIAGEWGPGRTLATTQADITKSAPLEIAFLCKQVHGRRLGE